jgi:cellulose biosynthesis protein BcsQ
MERVWPFHSSLDIWAKGKIGQLSKLKIMQMMGVLKVSKKIRPDPSASAPDPQMNNVAKLRRPNLFVVGIANFKGGVAKSTTATNLGVAAVRGKENVVIVDCDEPQFSSLDWASRREGRPPIVRSANARTINSLLDSAVTHGFTLAIIDLPGRGSAECTAILRCLDFAIVPCQPSAFDLNGSVTVRRALRDINVPHTVLLSRVRAANSRRALEYIERYSASGKVLDAVLLDRVAFSDSSAAGRSVIEWPGADARVAAESVFRIWHAVLDQKEIIYG